MSDTQQISDLVVGQEILLHRNLLDQHKMPTDSRAEVLEVTDRRAKIRLLDSSGHLGFDQGAVKTLSQSQLDEGWTYEVISSPRSILLSHKQFERVRDTISKATDHQSEEGRALLLAIDPDYVLPPVYDCFMQWHREIVVGDVLGVAKGPQQVLHNSRVVAWGFWPNGEDDTYAVLVTLDAHQRRIQTRASNSDHTLNYATFLWSTRDNGVHDTELFSNIVPAVADYREQKGMDY